MSKKQKFRLINSIFLYCETWNSLHFAINLVRTLLVLEFKPWCLMTLHYLNDKLPALYRSSEMVLHCATASFAKSSLRDVSNMWISMNICMFLKFVKCIHQVTANVCMTAHEGGCGSCEY